MPLVAAFARHRASAAAAASGLEPGARALVLPSLLHLMAVRLAGLDRATEIAAATYWERALEGIARRRPR